MGNTHVTVTNSDNSTMTKVNALEIREGLAENTGQVTIQGGGKGYVNPKKGEQAKIHFKASGLGTVKLKIYTTKGTLVWKTSKETDGSEDCVEWACVNTENSMVGSGIYILYIEGPGIKTTKKIAIVK